MQKIAFKRNQAVRELKNRSSYVINIQFTIWRFQLELTIWLIYSVPGNRYFLS